MTHMWKRVNGIFKINHIVCKAYVESWVCTMLLIMWYFEFNYFDSIRMYYNSLSCHELPVSLLTGLVRKLNYFLGDGNYVCPLLFFALCSWERREMRRWFWWGYHQERLLA